MHAYAPAPYTDAADSLEAATNHHPIDDIEPRPDPPTDVAVDIIRKLFLILSDERNIYLKLHCLAIAAGMGNVYPESMASLGRRFGISREAVDKEVRKFCKLFGLKSSRWMRSPWDRQVLDYYSKRDDKRVLDSKPPSRTVAKKAHDIDIFLKLTNYDECHPDFFKVWGTLLKPLTEHYAEIKRRSSKGHDTT